MMSLASVHVEEKLGGFCRKLAAQRAFYREKPLRSAAVQSLHTSQVALLLQLRLLVPAPERDLL